MVDRDTETGDRATEIGDRDPKRLITVFRGERSRCPGTRKPGLRYARRSGGEHYQERVAATSQAGPATNGTTTTYVHHTKRPLMNAALTL